MRVVWLNAWGGARWDELAAWLPGVGADVLCLQEVTRTPGAGGWTRFADGERDLPQRADLVAEVQALLPGHQGTFLTCDRGPVVDEAGRRHRQQFGIATFIAPHLPVVAAAAGPVHGRYADHAAWPASDRPRVAHALRLAPDGDGPAVVVAHLHGLRDAEGKGDTPARAAQAERLVALVDQVRQPGDLIAVGGDLNVLPGSSTHARFAAAGLVDLVGAADTRTSMYPRPVRHAGYAFVSDAAAVARFAVIEEPEVSDHRPLVLDLDVTGGQARRRAPA